MTPWVGRLIFLNVGMYFLSRVAPDIVPTLALVPGLIAVRPWTPLTYMFLHGDFWHLLFNMLGLYFFGPRLEMRLGSHRFAQLYFISGLTGALLSLGTPGAMIIGASGAVFGVFLGYARYWPRTQVLIWGIVPVEARILVILMTVMSLFGGRLQPGVAHLAHLGGFLGGWLCLKWFEARTRAAVAHFAPPPPRADPSAVDRWRKIDRATLHPVNAEELDRVLAKLNDAGANSLSAEEKAFLDRFGN